jgi:hypothetical protein
VLRQLRLDWWKWFILETGRPALPKEMIGKRMRAMSNGYGEGLGQ